MSHIGLSLYPISAKVQNSFRFLYIHFEVKKIYFENIVQNYFRIVQSQYIFHISELPKGGNIVQKCSRGSQKIIENQVRQRYKFGKRLLCHSGLWSHTFKKNVICIHNLWPSWPSALFVDIQGMKIRYIPYFHK